MSSARNPSTSVEKAGPLHDRVRLRRRVLPPRNIRRTLSKRRRSEARGHCGQGRSMLAYHWLLFWKFFLRRARADSAIRGPGRAPWKMIVDQLITRLRFWPKLRPSCHTSRFVVAPADSFRPVLFGGPDRTRRARAAFSIPLAAYLVCLSCVFRFCWDISSVKVREGHYAPWVQKATATARGPSAQHVGEQLDCID